MEAIQLLKSRLRQEMKARLAAVTTEEYSSFNSAIRQSFCELPVVKGSRRVMIYYAINREVTTALLINTLLAMGKTVALPACTADKSLRAGAIKDLNELVPGAFGLSEPGPLASEINPWELDLVVVPGLAFDQRGYRLGHGAGYYDRFLVRTNAFKLGLAYDFQIIAELPVAPHDIAVQALLTPSGYFKF